MVSPAGLGFPTLDLPSLPVTFARPAVFVLLALALFVYLVHRGSLRWLSPARMRLALAARLTILVLLTASLAGPHLQHAANRVAVAFLVDQSDSVSAAQQQQALDWIRQAVAVRGAYEKWEMIAFARDAVVDRPLGTGTVVPDLSSTLARDQSNLAEAIRLALSTLPSDMARQIIVLSDGAENAGSALDEARLASAAGVGISFVPLPGHDGQELLVRQVQTPASLREQDNFNIRVVVEANTSTPATIRVMLDGRLDSTYDVQVNLGTNVFSLQHGPLDKGFHSFQVYLDTGTDSIAENNVGGSYTTVIGKGKALIVEGARDEGRYLAEALRAGGLDVSTSAAVVVPADAIALRDFDSVVLVNVPAASLAGAQQQALKNYVQTFGGGLVVVGGDRSFGVGGYAGTALEEMLPVRMDLRGRRLQSSIALLLVIDTSGSMGEGPAGATKMDLAKQAAIQSVILLGEEDQIGVLAFEDTFRWVVKPTFLTDPDHVKGEIGTLAAGGGTDIFPALKEAYAGMAERSAKVRHIILMTDGIAPSGDYNSLLANLRRDNITLSTIAVGTDADFGLLQRLAAGGSGRYHEGIDPFDVPQLTVKETMEISRAAIVEKQVELARAGTSPIMEGLDLGAVPALAGYVATTAKPSSTTVIVSKEDDPLLVEWQYGLGQVVAWTSDAENRWAASWLDWPQFAQFWTQVVKRTIPSNLERNTHVEVTANGTTAKVVVDTLDDAGGYLNFLSSEATILGPDGTSRTITLPQVGPGRYEGSFPAGQEGAYAVAMTQRKPGEEVVMAAQSSGYVVPYSPEYRELAGNRDLLIELARAAGGVEMTNPEQAFMRTRPAPGTGRELWPFLVGAAILLFLLDVANRRLRIQRADLRRGWRQLREWWQERSRPITQPAADRLLSVKRRLAAEGGHRPRPSLPRVPVGMPITKAARESRKTDTAQTPTGAMGARLIEAKRRANRERSEPRAR